MKNIPFTNYPSLAVFAVELLGFVVALFGIGKSTYLFQQEYCLERL